MTKRFTRPAATVIGSVLALALPVTADATTPAHPHTIVGGGPSTQRAQLALVTGSSRYLIYEQSTTLTSSLTPFGAFPMETRLFVRSSTGTTTQLPASASDDAAFSISGPMLTAVHPHHDSDRKLDWWNLRSGHHGRVSLPKHTTYLTAARSGATYMRTDGTVWIATRGGGSKRLGRPFRHEPESYNRNTEVAGSSFAAAGDKGLALGDDHGHARYLAFGKPGRVVKLATKGNQEELCTAVNHRYAACVGAVDSGDGPESRSATITPLDGSAATTFRNRHHPRASLGTGSPIALHGSTMLWTHVRYPAQEQARPVSLRAGAHKPTVGTTPIRTVIGPIGAFGEAIYSNPDPPSDALLAATAADHIRRLVTAPMSPGSAASFALADGRIADVDDARGPDSDGAVTVRVRGISEKSGHIATHNPTTVATGSASGFYVSQVAVSSTAVAYVAAAGDSAEPTVHVVTSQGDQNLGGTVLDGLLVLSSQRLLYENNGPHQQWQLIVRDLSNGTDTRIAKRSYPNFPAAAIDGNFVAYMTNHGTVYRTDLTTGHRVKLATAPPHPRFVRNLRVYESGDWVGWSYDDGRLGQHHVDVIRNATTMASAVRLGNELIGLNSRGALLADNRRIIPPYGSSVGQVGGEPSAVRLRSWRGKLRLIASRQAFLEVPQLDGNTLAWIDGRGRLRAAVLGGQ